MSGTVIFKAFLLDGLCSWCRDPLKQWPNECWGPQSILSGGHFLMYSSLYSISWSRALGHIWDTAMMVLGLKDQWHKLETWFLPRRGSQVKLDPVARGSLNPSLGWDLACCPALETRSMVYYWTSSSHYRAVVRSEISIPGSELASSTWKKGDIGHVTKVPCASIGSSVKQKHYLLQRAIVRIK